MLSGFPSDGMRDVVLSEFIEKLIAFTVDGDDNDATVVPLLIAVSNI